MIKKLLLLSLVSSKLFLNSFKRSEVDTVDLSKQKIFLKKDEKLRTNNFNNIGNICLEHVMHYSKNTNFEISKIKSLYDFDDNLFVLVEFDPIGYAIYSVTNGDVIEIAPYSLSPYYDVEEEDIRYVYLDGYFAINNGNIINLKESDDKPKEGDLKIKSAAIAETFTTNINQNNIKLVSNYTAGSIFTAEEKNWQKNHLLKIS